MPYWIWLVLPRIFPEYLPGPGGYASLGIARQGRPRDADRPVESDDRLPAVGINCALCHTARFRAPASGSADDRRRRAAHQTGEQEYLRFLIACASDPRFTADTILGEIARNYRLSRPRPPALPIRRSSRAPAGRSFASDDESAWMHERPDWGRGRIDSFNLVKFTLLRQPMDDTIGTADMMPVWNLKGSTKARLPLGRAQHVLDRGRRARRRSARAPRGSGSIAMSRTGRRPIRRERRACGEFRTSSRASNRRSTRSRSTAAAGSRRAGRLHERVRVLPRRWRRAHRHARSRRRSRHRSSPARHVDEGLGGGVQRLRRRPRLEVFLLSDDHRLRGGSARRPLAARAVSPQRLGAVAGRPARGSRAAAEDVLARLRSSTTR